MKDLVGASVDIFGPVALCLPIEGCLHRVFNCESTSRNKEEMAELIGYGNLTKGLDESGELPGVHVAVGGVADCRRQQGSDEAFVAHHQMIVAEGQRCEVAVAIEVFLPLQGIHHDAAVGFLKVDHNVKAIDQDIVLQRRKDGIGRNGDHTHCRLH